MFRFLFALSILLVASSAAGQQPESAEVSDIHAVEIAEMFGEKFVIFSANQPDSDLKTLAKSFLDSESISYGGPLIDWAKNRGGRKKSPEEIDSESKTWLERIRERRKEVRAARLEILKWLALLIVLSTASVVIVVAQIKKIVGG